MIIWLRKQEYINKLSYYECLYYWYNIISNEELQEWYLIFYIKYNKKVSENIITMWNNLYNKVTVEKYVVNTKLEGKVKVLYFYFPTMIWLNIF